jgi:hypothetical protein
MLLFMLPQYLPVVFHRIDIDIDALVIYRHFQDVFRMPFDDIPGSGVSPQCQ